MLKGKKRIHFVGIGGIGMSGIAKVLLEMGHDVSGSDLEHSNLTKKIEALGGRFFPGHKTSNLSRGTRLLVYSSSISKDNPEMREALRRKIRIAHRAEVLGAIFNERKGIAVTGTHGKTTTTSLIAVMLKNLKRDPTVIIGGEVASFEGNAKLGKGAYMVAEADESDSSFLNLSPLYAVITNIEMEHMDHFADLSHIRRSFRSFVDNVKKGGVVFYNAGDENTAAVLKGYTGRTETFGFSKDADAHPLDIRLDGFNTSFICVYKGKTMGEVRLKIPGRHNVLNALAAISVGMNLGFAFKDIVRSIGDFGGAKRRFQLRADEGGVMLIEDYAHHPTEIRAVLDACRTWQKKRIIAVFQPHRYTRTKFLADEFASCFDGVSKLILTDIYAASEKPIRGVTSKALYNKIRASGLADVELMDKERVAGYLMKIKKPGDMIVIMGAGDIKHVANELCEMMTSGAACARDVSADREFMAALRRAVKGRVRTGERLSAHTSFRIGGPADVWVEPADERDLRRLLAFVNIRKAPLFVMGNGSNILASDGGFRGIVVYLGGEAFRRLKIEGRRITVGAGFPLPRLVRTACEKGLGGLESLVGIPGTVGGAIFMNAGGWTNPIFKNMGDLVVSLRVMDYNGRTKVLGKDQIEFGYRHTNLAPYIILEATLRTEKSDAATLVSSSASFLSMKKEKQALDLPSAGCVFKNPDRSQFTCGQMIDMLQLKGRRIGGAEVSEKHANFVVNRCGATCRDVLDLIDLIKAKVKENYGINLEMEVKVL